VVTIGRTPREPPAPHRRRRPRALGPRRAEARHRLAEAVNERPATRHSEAYRERLCSPEWRRLGVAVLKRQHGRCRGCGRRDDHPVGTPIAAHHLHYRTLGHERPQDLVALCRFCHELADERRAAETAAESARALWEARVAGWAEKAGLDPDEPATEEAFEEWLERQPA